MTGFEKRRPATLKRPCLNRRCVQRRLARPGFALVIGLVFTAWSRPSFAQPGEAATTPTTTTTVEVAPPVVEIRVVGSQSSLDALRQILGSQRLGKAELRWSLAPSFAPQQILSLLPPAKVKIHCWLDLEDPATAHLYFVAPLHDRFMLRDFDLQNRFGSFEHESIAQIIELSVGVLLTDAEAGISRREAQAALKQNLEPAPAPVTPPTSPAAPNPTRFGVAVAASYGLLSYSREVPVLQGPGLGLILERHAARSRQQLGLTGRYALPHRIKNDTAGADIDRTDLALSMTFLFAAGASKIHFWGPSLAGGLGFVGASPVAGTLPGTYDLARNNHELEGYLALGLAWATDLQQRLSTELKLSLILVPRPIRHEFAVDESRETLTEGRNLRLGATIALYVR